MRRTRGKVLLGTVLASTIMLGATIPSFAAPNEVGVSSTTNASINELMGRLVGLNNNINIHKTIAEQTIATMPDYILDPTIHSNVSNTYNALRMAVEEYMIARAEVQDYYNRTIMGGNLNTLGLNDLVLQMNIMDTNIVTCNGYLQQIEKGLQTYVGDMRDTDYNLEELLDCAYKCDSYVRKVMYETSVLLEDLPSVITNDQEYTYYKDRYYDIIMTMDSYWKVSEPLRNYAYYGGGSLTTDSEINRTLTLYAMSDEVIETYKIKLHSVDTLLNNYNAAKNALTQ